MTLTPEEGRRLHALTLLEGKRIRGQHAPHRLPPDLQTQIVALPRGR